MSFAFEASGKIKLPSQEELEKADENTAILAYTSGTMSDGRPYWAYVAVKPSLYREFHALSQSGQQRVIGDYGTVLAAGFAAHPPQDVVQKMFEQYGADPAFEESLVQQFRKEQSAVAAKHEDKRIMDIVTMLKKKG